MRWEINREEAKIFPRSRMGKQMGKKPLVFAYYVTGHGFGHATRVLEVFFFKFLCFFN